MLNVITSLKMGNKNIYWKGFEELNKDSEIVENLEQNEFVEKLPVGKEDKDNNPNRRDFLKYAGFSTAAAAIVGCEGPVSYTHLTLPTTYEV